MKQSKAFTLIELLVVIAIIGFIASIVLVNLQGVRGRGRIAAGKQFSSSLQHTLGAYAVGIWRFEDGSGTTALDGSGYINSGTLNGGATWRTETECGLELGGCLEFDGVDDEVTILNFNYGILKQGSENAKWSISMWAKETGTNANERIMAGRRGCNGGIYTLNGGYAFAIKTTGCWTDSKTIATIPSNMDTWHHLVAVYDNRAMSFYVDGVLAGTDVFTSTMYNYGNTFGVGGINPYLFNGIIDDVHIFNTSLTTVQIEQLYVQGMQKHQLVYR